MGYHARLYIIAYILLLFIVGLWPFNFTEKNNAVISPTGGLEIARHGTAYTALPAGKLQDLKQFSIHIDLTTSSDGLGSLEKIFGYFISQEVENFFLGQWKDGLELHVRTERNAGRMIFGADGVLKKEERAACLIMYDGLKMHIYKNGILLRRDTRGPLSFSNWSREYPLVLGTDATGRSQWRGNLYEVAIYDRAMSPSEVASLSNPNGHKGTRDEGVGTSAAKRQERKSQQPTADSRKQQATLRGSTGSLWQLREAQPQAALRQAQGGTATRQENPPVSPFMKGGSGKGEGFKEAGTVIGPIIHYVFKTENTYETEFRGKKALGVRDLGKGGAADLVIPEHFAPYERVSLGWDTDWMKRSSDWLDVAVNILGFVPFGILMIFAARAKKCLSVLVPECLSEEKEGTRDEGVGTSGRKKVVAVILAVVAGFVVSFAIEYLQAYLPSRDSSLKDLVTNTLGTAMGAVIATQLLRNRFAPVTGDQPPL